MAADHYLLLNEEPWAGPIAFRVAGSDVSMKRGRRLKSPPGPLRYELRVDKTSNDPLLFPPLDWHNAPDGQALFSERLIACLVSAGVSNIDYYDAEVLYVPTQSLQAYKVANVVGIASLLDRAASRFEADEDGFITELHGIRLDPERCRGHDLVRLLERPSILVISAALRARLEAVAITGLLMIEDTEWEPGLI